MNGTPRLRSGFPSTPPTTRTTPRQQPSPASSSGYGSPKLRDISELNAKKPDPNAPLIPFETIDAPSQRLYVAGLYTAFFLWRLYDFFNLYQDQEESLWLFMKWVAIDGTFLFGLPGLRIPWLEWSSTTMTILFLFHAVFDGVLMFRIPIPLGSALIGFTKLLYDREIAISEHRVKPGSILHDPSHILGAYTIHVLPEGSAVLNPEKTPLCLGGSRSASTLLPLQINQTLPTSIELVRFDLQTPGNETIKLGASQTRKLIKAAEKRRDHHSNGALLLEYPVTKPGLYRIGKIIDDTNMEVAHPISETLVVQCPKASIKPSGPVRCRGDLSNIALQVEGSPPLEIKYRKIVNGEENAVNYQSIQPDDFASPLTTHSASGPGPLISTTNPDLSWAGYHQIIVPLNETLSRQGLWSYSIDEVVDAHGNSEKYTREDSEYEIPKPKAAHLEDEFMVYHHPVASLGNHNSRVPVRKAKGERLVLPIRLTEGDKPVTDGDYKVEYKFTPIEDVKDNGDHADDAKVFAADFRNSKQMAVSKPGFYTLVSVESDFCAGDVEEPTSFLLVNPPEPQVNITWEPISDKCAGRPIGLHVDLQMEGSPEFKVMYSSQRRGGPVETQWARFQGPRGQLEFRPESAGHWSYKFMQLEDSVYKGIDLRSQNLVLEQEVRPSVFASFTSRAPSASTCIDEPVSFDVKFQGEGPWTLEYELVHGRQREKKIVEVSQELYTITTPPLTKGGEYSLALVGVTDKEGCREGLQQDAKISVRHQRPRASFGLLEGKRSIRTLESRPVDLPVRLTGEGPWSVGLQHYVVDDSGERRPGTPATMRINNPNDVVRVTDPGYYEITSVRDRLCPGSTDDKAQGFDVSLIARPKALVLDSPLVETTGDNKYARTDVCEGDEDSVDLAFSGRPPYDVKFDQHFKSDKGVKSLRRSDMNVALNSAKVKFETSEAGTYEYVFTELSDYNYDHEPRAHKPLVIQQKVHAKPSALFASGNKIHSLCQSKTSPTDSEPIPITLTGLPPFTVEIEIRHATASKAAKPQTLTIPNLLSRSVSLSIPHRMLQPGSSTINVHRVRDARGCERIYDSAFLTSSSNTQRQAALANAPPRMQVAVHDAPSLSPMEPEKVHHCVGDRLAFALSGTAPFNVQYTFRGSKRKASVDGQTFRRIAETPGNFTIGSISDSASACQADVRDVSRMIHDLPRVRVSKGKNVRYDIHAGGSVDVVFEFDGEPPFTFTYERREAPRTKPQGGKGGAGQEYGRPGKVLGTRTLVAETRSLTVSETQEGTYEVVAVSDRWCRYARPGYDGVIGARGGVADDHLLEDEDDVGNLLED